MLSIFRTEPRYWRKLLSYHNVDVIDDSIHQPKVNNFAHYNMLVDMNKVFSTAPSGDIIDRTRNIDLPWKMYIQRPWLPEASTSTLDEIIAARVKKFDGMVVNLFWSGGIDSTSMVIGFLRHRSDLSTVRILHSTYSMKENPGFYLLLQSHGIELIDLGGREYLNQAYNGVFLTADGVDDLTASLDRSFFDTVGYRGLHSPWIKYFKKQNSDIKFLELAEEFFSYSQRPIATLLEARWWFYTICKIQKWAPATGSLLNDHQPIPIAFYDCYDFEHFMYNNIELSIANHNYDSYKQFLKDYIYEYDNNYLYHKFKHKENSGQLVHYTRKRNCLLNTDYILLLSDGQRIRTDNLPFLSEHEYRQKYGNTLNCLFN